MKDYRPEMSFDAVERDLPVTLGRKVASVLALVVASVLLSITCSDGARPELMSSPLAGGACFPTDSQGDVVEVRDGPFEFEVGLYADESLVSFEEAVAPSLWSDIPGVGWRSVWSYEADQGEEIGPVREGYGLVHLISGDIALFAQAITSGATGGHARGGVGLRNQFSANDRIGLGSRVQVGNADYAAGVFFTVAEGPTGELEACDAYVTRGWPLEDPRRP
jgi:hypothetical protein